ncbi:unnamed protein product (macronuclear) [Paramecium tetraurelia]|uniref:Insertion element IS150 protein InsJ-like helix-turn-helix domain-containing protein n=1 Tax=Paramecium tetraurelia TaxID=5888 RepID=A0CQF0_PARTE|nr:uncharacterized protein GSPATT00009365001 [Paramecium tetraurelia]CAK73017.1 unnamed protein product [Paramecium tetraurelia]|eukprot:XP_001440414.1 hypothetical protein (macronuclear) [Paramecium tetraurelia strain d4-2]
MKYAKISNQVRQAFIKRISEKKCTIRQAAKQFGIKFSTAKAILSIYRHEGRIGKKQRRQRKLSNNIISEKETQKSLKEEPIETKEEIKKGSTSLNYCQRRANNTTHTVIQL